MEGSWRQLGVGSAGSNLCCRRCLRDLRLRGAGLCLKPLEHLQVAFLIQLVAGLQQAADQPAAVHGAGHRQATVDQQQPGGGAGGRWGGVWLCWWRHWSWRIVHVHVHRDEMVEARGIQSLLVEHLVHHLLGPQVPVGTGGGKPDGQGGPAGSQRYRASAGGARASRLRSSSHISRAVMSAWLTPGMRLAWPRVVGWMLPSFSRASLERVPMLA